MDSQSSNTPAPKTHGFQFNGSGGEFFRIWIVNILLTIVTLGIYSAWAKVRTNRYMYGNTEVAGDHFEYLAEPMQILRGRLIAIGFFILYAALATLSPGAELILLLVLALGTPWIIARSLAFRARMTSYRNIRFRFTGSAAEAAKEFLLMPLLIIPTLGLILPYIRYRQVRFVTSNHSYGTSRFAFAAKAGDYYTIMLVALGMSIAAVLVLTVLAGGAAAITAIGASSGDKEPAMLPIFASMALFYVAFGLIGTYVKAAETNLMMRNLSTKGVTFDSNLGVMGLFGIYVSNLLLVALTLGLYYPWAVVRLHKYRAAKTDLIAIGEMDQFVAASQEEGTATGEELGEVFDVDFAL